MKVTMAQLNPTVGDIEGNFQKAVEVLERCGKEKSDLVIFSELFLLGYPPRDLLEKKSVIKKTQSIVNRLANISLKYPHTGILIGCPQPTNKNTGKGLYNSALLIYQGTVTTGQYKSLLPTYDVFDEARYFDPSPEIKVLPFKNQVLGISVCEDAWSDPKLFSRHLYPINPIAEMAEKGATVFINISASPFSMGKEKIRFEIFQNHAKKHNLPFIYVNQIGGNDELIFDGRSMVIDKNGRPLKIFPSFEEHIDTIDLSIPNKPVNYLPQEKIESVYQALVLGIRDYVKKCGFKSVVLGLSGGIDSSVTCCLARDALGADNVLGITMPSPYSSRGSVEDSRRLAANLGIHFEVIPITDIYESYKRTLAHSLKLGEEVEITLENIQARIRGDILMAFSNKYGHLVISAGNKSELAVGYCTLYGDMAGGLAAISDVPKTMVYQLAEYINRKGEVIPAEIIEKEPSAELRPDMKDLDSLPPYEILDQILYCYINESLSLEEIVERGFDAETVKQVIKDVDRNEYKRKQAPPGLKVTTKAFGIGRKMPIAAIYHY